MKYYRVDVTYKTRIDDVSYEFEVRTDYQFVNLNDGEVAELGDWLDYLVRNPKTNINGFVVTEVLPTNLVDTIWQINKVIEEVSR